MPPPPNLPPSRNLELRTVLRMTRPGFCVITLAGCVLGWALAQVRGATPEVGSALLATGVALLMHAAANVLNDYQDARNGADDANQSGLFPFTGGARLIQDGVVSAAQTLRLAQGLFVASVLGGACLFALQGEIVLWLGIAGLGLGWAYSAPPLALMQRGIGEVAVALAWAGVVWGEEALFTREFATPLWPIALGYGALIANILLINGLPDAAADARVGKRTLAVRLGPRGVTGLYALLLVAAQGGLAVTVAQGHLVPAARWAHLSALTGAAAVGALVRHAHAPARLRSAIVLTIATALGYAGLLSASV